MGRKLLVALLMVCGCGRIGFVASPAGSDGGVADTAGDTNGVPAGAVLYLPFNATPAGPSFQDVAGSHVVNCSPGCPAPVAGIRGGASRFDPNTPDVLVATYKNDLDPSGGFTIAVWVRLASLPQGPYYCFLMKPVGTGSYNSWGLCVDPGASILFHTGTVGGTDNLNAGTLSVGAWHHVAMTWDGTTKRGYVDAVLEGSRAVPVANDTGSIIIGADENSGSTAYPLDGDLDEVFVFDRVLDDAEIAELAR